MMARTGVGHQQLTTHAPYWSLAYDAFTEAGYQEIVTLYAQLQCTLRMDTLPAAVNDWHSQFSRISSVLPQRAVFTNKRLSLTAQTSPSS